MWPPPRVLSADTHHTRRAVVLPWLTTVQCGVLLDTHWQLHRQTHLHGSGEGAESLLSRPDDDDHHFCEFTAERYRSNVAPDRLSNVHEWRKTFPSQPACLMVWCP
jgi:hypothetical protein